MHTTAFPVVDPVDVLLVLLAGVGVVLALTGLVVAGQRLRDVLHAALLELGRSWR